MFGLNIIPIMFGIKNKARRNKNMFVDANNIKFIIFQYYREHNREYPTLMQIVEYINVSDSPDKTKKKYHKIEIAFILQQAVKQGVLLKEKVDKVTYYKIRAEAMPIERPIEKEVKVWDGSLEVWKPDLKEEDIWQPDKPGKSKDFWNGERENLWKVK